MMVVHNQMVLLGYLMGIYLDTFIHDESCLPLLFDAAYQEQITDDLHQLGYLAPGNIYRTPSSNGGHASVALAGEFSEELGRDRATMPERGHASAAVAGEYSEALGRDRATASERGHAAAALAGTFSRRLGRDRATLAQMNQAAADANTDILVNFSYRAIHTLPWSDWLGTRYINPRDHQDGISRYALAPAHVKGMAMIGPQPVPTA